MAEDKKEFLDFTGLDHYDEKLHESINDYTTGINLMRGTKDFAYGSILAPRNKDYQTLYKDGFREDVTNDYQSQNVTRTRLVDEDGYTVLETTVVSSWSYYAYSNVISAEPGETYTFSMDFCLSDTVGGQNFRLGYLNGFTNSIDEGPNDDSVIEIGTFNTNVLDSVEAGKWYRGAWSFTIPQNVKSLYVRLLLERPTTIKVRKLKLERGRINNPIWSASPFDVNSINDYTTGINLLRGTRDFIVGKETMPKQTTRYKDGFWKDNQYSIEYDDNGFAVAHITYTGSTWRNLYTSGVYVESGDVITCSIDFKVDNVQDATYSNGKVAPAAFEFYDTNSNSRIKYEDWFIDPKILKDGEWTRISKSFTIPELSYDGKLYVIMRLQLATGGSIYFRKAKLEFGHINNPVWSPSPFDVDYVNDITTAPNLLIGSKDFVPHTSFAVSPYGSDGWNFAAPYEKTVDSNGYSVIKIPNDTTSRLYANAVPGIKEGDVYTLSFDINVEDTSEINYSAVIGSIYHRVIGSTDKQTQNVTLTSLGFTKDNLEAGKWYRVKFVTESLKDVIDGEVFLLVFRNASMGSAYSISKPLLNAGNINHPVWTFSPSDINIMQNRLDSVNDYTTGINLIRGTRDFKKGTDKINSIISNDGFYFQGNPTPPITYDAEGFAVMTETNGSQSAWSSPINGLKSGDEITASLDFKLDSIAGISENLAVGVFLIRSLDWSTARFVQNISIKDTGIPIEKIEANTWYRATCPIVIKGDIEETDIGIVSTQSNTLMYSNGISHRKLMAQYGLINNTIWSPSPFDLATTYELDSINDYTTGINLVRGTKDFKLGSIPENEIYYKDGFNNQYANFTFFKDEDGYTVAHKENSGSTTNQEFRLISSLTEPIKPGEKITISFDVKLDKSIPLDISHLMVVLAVNADNLTPGASVQLGYGTFGLDYDTMESGKWYRVKYIYTAIDQFKGAASRVNVRLMLMRNGSVYYRKLDIQKGVINNPIWSPSPFDIDSINDETTGLNLLKQSKYLLQGSGTSTYRPDGWSWSTNTVQTVVLDDDFTYAELSPDNNTRLYSPRVTEIEEIPYTLSFEYYFEDENESTSSAFVCSVNQANSLSGQKKSFQFAFNSIGIDLKSVVPGVWYKCIAHVPTLTNVEEGDYLGIAFTNHASNKTKIRIRKICLYKGTIINPIWNSNPFDSNSNKSLGALRVYKSGNLNDLVSFGPYRVLNGVENTPNTTAVWVVDVISANGSGSDNYIRQKAYAWAATADEFVRERIDGQWSPWVRTVNNKNVVPADMGGTAANRVQDAIPNLLQNGTLINDKEELDSITHEISFKLARSAVNDYVPEQGRLLRITTSGQGTNIIFADNRTVPSAYIRSYYPANRQWSDWYKMYTSADVIPETNGGTGVKSFNAAPYSGTVYTGRNIATKFTSEIGSNHIANWLASRVSQGNFEGLNIGDYVDIKLTDNTTVRYLIAGIDTYYRGGTVAYPHHLIMVPSDALRLNSSDGSYGVGNNNQCIMWNTEANNNGTATEAAPYMTSNIHKWEIEVFLPKFPQEWQDVMLERNQVLETRYSASSALNSSTGVSWKNMGKIWSPSEVELIGRCSVGTRFYSDSFDCQFPLYYQLKNYVFRAQFWTRTVQDESSRNVCMMGGFGNIGGSTANTATAFPYPCFMIG